MISRFYKTLVFFSSAFLAVHVSFAQQSDADTTAPKPHSPRLATIMSAVVPGSGQVYNKKYWKVPVIYAGFGVLTYFIIDNNKLYKDFKEAYIIRNDGDPNTLDKYTPYSNEGLLQAQNYYRRNMELSVIFSVVLYTLNIVDAAVDAHLYYFDISEDLSLELKPVILQPPLSAERYQTGLRLTLKF